MPSCWLGSISSSQTVVNAVATGKASGKSSTINEIVVSYEHVVAVLLVMVTFSVCVAVTKGLGSGLANGLLLESK
ncbi:hypothetical protein D3C84_510300 [compost metagenome]